MRARNRQRNRQLTQLLCCVPLASVRRAHSIQCAIDTQPRSRIQPPSSRATAAQSKVIGSDIRSKPLHTSGLTHGSLAVAPLNRKKHQANIDHLGVAAATKSILSSGKNS